MTFNYVNGINYNLLIEKKIIPDIHNIISIPVGRIPKWVNNKDTFLKNAKEVFLHQKLYNNDKNYEFVLNFSKKVMDTCEYKKNYQIVFNDYKIIIDAISFQKNGIWIMDIDLGYKSSFISQLLRGYIQIAILRENNFKCDWLLLTFLLQQEIKIINLSNWNSTLFYKYINNHFKWLNDDFLASDNNFLNLDNIDVSYTYPVGYHISIDTHPNIGFPFQIYLNSRLTSKNKNTTDNRLDTIKKLVINCRNYNNRVGKHKVCDFVSVHTPLNFNLCNSDEYISKILTSELLNSIKIEANCIVVHLGSKIENLTTDECLDIMESNIRNVLSLTTKHCPILLETSAGERNDICICPEDLLNFIKRFNNDKRIGICLDTCHVFSSGYDPAWYLMQVIDYVKLIHYNDSNTRRGGCCDHHASLGNGHIGLKRMYLIKNIAANLDIPLITE